MDRQPDGPAGVGDASGDGLADPPGGVGRELEALAPVELLDGVHEAEVPLLDQVEQGQAGRLVLLGDGDDQAEVGLHEGLLGLLTGEHGSPELPPLAARQALRSLLELLLGRAASLDGLGKPDLVVLGEQRVLADIGQVEPYEVLVVPLDAFLCQVCRPFLHYNGTRRPCRPEALAAPSALEPHRRDVPSVYRARQAVTQETEAGKPVRRWGPAPAATPPARLRRRLPRRAIRGRAGSPKPRRPARAR